MFGRRYFWESALWVIAFIATIELAGWLAQRWPGDAPWRVLAIVPVIFAMAAGTWVELRQVARMDELQRQIYLVATVTGAMLMIFFCGVAYVGEALQLWARVAPIYAILALGVGFVIGYYGARRRYA